MSYFFKEDAGSPKQNRPLTKICQAVDLLDEGRRIWFMQCCDLQKSYPTQRLRSCTVRVLKS